MYHMRWTLNKYRGKGNENKPKREMKDEVDSTSADKNGPSQARIQKENKSTMIPPNIFAEMKEAVQNPVFVFFMPLKFSKCNLDI